MQYRMHVGALRHIQYSSTWILALCSFVSLRSLTVDGLLRGVIVVQRQRIGISQLVEITHQASNKWLLLGVWTDIVLVKELRTVSDSQIEQLRLTITTSNDLDEYRTIQPGSFCDLLILYSTFTVPLLLDYAYNVQLSTNS